MTNIQLPKGKRSLLAALFAASGLSVFFLQNDRLGHGRSLFAVLLGLCCVACGLYQAIQMIRNRGLTSSARTDLQEGRRVFAVVVLINLIWFLVSTAHGAVGEADARWRNPVVDLNNSVQMAALFTTLSLIQMSHGVPRIDMALRRWLLAMCFVLAANYLALVDTHWHHLPQAVTGHAPLNDRTWFQWRITNSCTIVAYSLGGVLVFSGVSLRRSCIVGCIVAVVAAMILVWRYGGI